MDKKKGPTDKGKTNFSDYFFLNVNNPFCVLLTSILTGFLFKLREINDKEPVAHNLNQKKGDAMNTIEIAIYFLSGGKLS